MPAKRYLWDSWLAKHRFILRRGKDYDCSQSSMAQQIRSAASKRHVHVQVVEGNGEITVLVSKEQASGGVA